MVVSNAYSANMRSAFVLSEEGSTACGISDASTVAAVEAVLRQNNIKIDKQYTGAIFYITLNAMDLGNGCVASFGLQAYYLQTVKIPSIKKEPLVAKVELCSFGHLATGTYSQVENRVHQKLSSFTEMCISEIEKK
jgi:hypothetical protein